MPVKKRAPTFVRLEDNLPRPVSGDGEVIVSIGEQDVIVRWEKGEAVEARPASDEGVPGIDMKIESKSLGAIQCYK